MLLRPHHINCIYFYQGKGYDKDFCVNMVRIITSLKEDKSIKIRFIKGCDGLCSKCPNREINGCKTEKHIKELDRKAIFYYGLNLNRKYTFREITNIQNRKLNQNFHKMCSSCEWYKIGVCKL